MVRDKTDNHISITVRTLSSTFITQRAIGTGNSVVSQGSCIINVTRLEQHSYIKITVLRGRNATYFQCRINMQVLILYFYFLIEDLRTQILLQYTTAYDELLRELQGKRDSIEERFYITDAMVNREQTQEEYELRHIMARFAIHGFHHHICPRKTFHQANQE